MTEDSTGVHNPIFKIMSNQSQQGGMQPSNQMNMQNPMNLPSMGGNQNPMASGMGGQSQMMNNQMGMNNGQMDPNMMQQMGMNNGQMNPNMMQQMGMNNGQMDPNMMQQMGMNNGQMDPNMMQQMGMNNGQMNPNMMQQMGMNNGQMDQNMMQQMMLMQQMQQIQQMQKMAQMQQFMNNQLNNQMNNQMNNQNSTQTQNQSQSNSDGNERGGKCVIFRKSGEGQNEPPIMIQCMDHEKVSEVIARYRVKTGDQDGSKKFIFNAKQLNESLSVSEAGLTNNANIFVVTTRGVKGALFIKN